MTEFANGQVAGFPMTSAETVLLAAGVDTSVIAAAMAETADGRDGWTSFESGTEGATNT
ncbi:MAG TPA: hypothetical protein VFB59_03335 [Candidatus Saccharimonadales bacterium]|nr:hypothetical protein [Candidatus Saccharimonadales bacterium]